MVRKQSPRVKKSPRSTPGSRVIDLLLPIFATLGVTFSDRPQQDILAGIVKGLSDFKCFFGEVWAGEDEIHVKIWDTTLLYEERDLETRKKVEQINSRPDFGTSAARWLRIVVTEPRAGGGKHVMLVARIKAVDGELTSAFCGEKIRTVVEVIKNSWPLR